MKSMREENYLSVLNRELIPALGCTEPVAIAYAAAKARSVLGQFPERMVIRCSGNIIKNVKGVTVPNSNGLRGVDVAAVLGVVGGDAERELEVLEGITPAHIKKTKELLAANFCRCEHQREVENLYISAAVFAGEHFAEVTMINRHTLITKIVHDGEILYSRELSEESGRVDWALWSVKDILVFAEEVDIAKVQNILDRQIEMNTRVSKEGLSKNYGAQVGKTLLEIYGDNLETRARAKAAAGSDARMGGCSMPVVINSGSGNQGITITLPIVEYAMEWKVPKETLYRALLIGNLISIYQKQFIGNLSAFCGAVTASSGVGAAITYMAGGGYEKISQTITNIAGNVGGIVCDGAKASCAAKIASAVDAAILGHRLSMKGLGFHAGEGIVQKDVDETIRSIGYVGCVGMKQTDVEILKIMLDKVDL